MRKKGKSQPSRHQDISTFTVMISADSRSGTVNLTWPIRSRYFSRVTVGVLKDLPKLIVLERLQVFDVIDVSKRLINQQGRKKRAEQCLENMFHTFNPLCGGPCSGSRRLTPLQLHQLYNVMVSHTTCLRHHFTRLYSLTVFIFISFWNTCYSFEYFLPLADDPPPVRGSGGQLWMEMWGCLHHGQPELMLLANYYWSSRKRCFNVWDPAGLPSLTPLRAVTPSLQVDSSN
jgi:hypothetical protein